jgi:hypothetical protein
VLTPWSFSPDGRWRISKPKQTRISLPLDLSDPEHPKPGQPEPFLQTPAAELAPRFSPNGHWIDYRSNESGSSEVYVRPFPPGAGGKWQISSGGGLYAIWSSDGHSLFYQAADNRTMVLHYKAEGTTFSPGKPHPWSAKKLSTPGLRTSISTEWQAFPRFCAA